MSNPQVITLKETICLTKLLRKVHWIDLYNEHGNFRTRYFLNHLQKLQQIIGIPVEQLIVGGYNAVIILRLSDAQGAPRSARVALRVSKTHSGLLDAGKNEHLLHVYAALPNYLMVPFSLIYLRLNSTQPRTLMIMPVIDECFDQREVPANELLDVAIKLAELIADLHQWGAHGDLHAGNVAYV